MQYLADVFFLNRNLMSDRLLHHEEKKTSVCGAALVMRRAQRSMGLDSPQVEMAYQSSQMALVL